MFVYNFPKDTVPKIILSSQVQKEKVRDYVVVKLSEGKIFCNRHSFRNQAERL